MRLPRAVVRILAEDDDAHFVERRVPERVEDVGTGWINLLALRFLLAEKLRQRQHLRPIEVIADTLLPRGFQPHAIVQPSALSRRCSATRSWKSSLVISNFSSTGFSTRSLAPAR